MTGRPIRKRLYARDLKPGGVGAQLSVILEVEGRRLWRCVALGDLVVQIRRHSGLRDVGGGAG
jgi:hypothetical protein